MENMSYRVCLDESIDITVEVHPMSGPHSGISLHFVNKKGYVKYNERPQGTLWCVKHKGVQLMNSLPNENFLDARGKAQQLACNDYTINDMSEFAPVPDGNFETKEITIQLSPEEYAQWKASKQRAKTVFMKGLGT